VTRFHNSSAQFLSVWCSNFSKLSDSRCEFTVQIYFSSDRRQKVFNRRAYVCALGDWDSKRWQKLNWL